MAKYPKFLEADNPNDTGPDKCTYIIHTQFPRFIAQVFISAQEDEIMDFQQMFDIGGKTDYKEFSAVIGVLEFWDPLPKVEDVQAQADGLAKLMRRCADWYYLILKASIDEE